MKTKIIDENVMSYFYEKDSWLYWKNSNGTKIKKDSLAGSLYKNNGYYKVRINGKYYFNHRILYQFYYNIILKETDFIDHINGITTDNRKENLRICTQSQNNMNKKVQKNNLTTGLKNISILKTGIYEYYRIIISKYKKVVFSNYYRTDKYTLEDMIKIRDEQLKILHGDFYRLK